jgi:hypothetical protein
VWKIEWIILKFDVLIDIYVWNNDKIIVTQDNFFDLIAFNWVSRKGEESPKFGLFRVVEFVGIGCLLELW